MHISKLITVPGKSTYFESVISEKTETRKSENNIPITKYNV